VGRRARIYLFVAGNRTSDLAITLDRIHPHVDKVATQAPSPTSSAPLSSPRTATSIPNPIFQFTRSVAEI
jgi:hypothetical protein